jgi:hypothetical protein
LEQLQRRIVSTKWRGGGGFLGNFGGMEEHGVVFTLCYWFAVPNCIENPNNVLKRSMLPRLPFTRGACPYRKGVRKGYR